MNIEKVNSKIPLGKQKIADALRTLIMKKDFNRKLFILCWI